MCVCVFNPNHNWDRDVVKPKKFKYVVIFEYDLVRKKEFVGVTNKMVYTLYSR